MRVWSDVRVWMCVDGGAVTDGENRTRVRVQVHEGLRAGELTYREESRRVRIREQLLEAGKLTHGEESGDVLIAESLVAAEDEQVDWHVTC
eukprot:1297652-Rhodomonas_salina.1